MQYGVFITHVCDGSTDVRGELEDRVGKLEEAEELSTGNMEDLDSITQDLDELDGLLAELEEAADMVTL